MLRICVVVLFFVAIKSSADKLPEYFNPCHLNQPDLNKCIDERIQVVLPTLIKGDKTFNLPALSPFSVTLRSPPNAAYRFLLSGKAQGLESVQFINTTFDTKTFLATAKVYFPKLVVTGAYEMKGKVLDRAFKVDGNANITFDDIKYDFAWQFAFYKKNGADHLKIVDVVYAYAVKDAIFSFGYQHDEDEEQVKEMNEFFNLHRKILAADISPSLAESFKDLTVYATSAVVAYASFQDLFLP